MNRLIYIATTVFLAVLCVLNPISAAALNYDIDFKLNSGTVYMVNTDTQTEIYSYDAEVKRYPASTTKIMTYIITVDNVSDIKNTKVEIKDELLHSLDGTESSVAGLEDYVGKSLSVYDLLCCLMVKSGNDAAVVLADFVGKGNQSSFVEMMNQKAAQLGCSGTHFVNPHGLHDEEQYTTAKDLYLITECAMSMPYFSEICAMSSYYLPDSDYPLVATNLLVDEGRGGDYYYRWATGIKTGTTDEAGYCLVASAVKDGYSYICIALDSPCVDSDGDWIEENGAMEDCINMFDWAFDNFEIKTIVDKETPVCSVNLESAWNKDTLLLVPENNYSAILPYDVEASAVTVTPDVPKSVEAPVKKGDIIGTAQIVYNDEILATINLAASESVDRSEVVKVTNTVKTAALSNWVVIPIAILAVLFVLYIILATILKKRMDSQKKMQNK
ncbi:MAG: D-alanyl-D-alanine carboxypeptidase [Clostridiales bacterium]|nr:D-alanyl-D-alanine carboxypeptidase [Clostridiales bacterium]